MPVKQSLSILAACLALSFGTLANANADEPLDLEGFLIGVEQAKTFHDLTTYLRAQPLTEHDAFGLLSSVDGTPRNAERPQAFVKTGNVWSGMGGKFYDIIISPGETNRPLLYFQLTQIEGRLVINDDAELTPSKIREMSYSNLVTWNEGYNKQVCYGCHKGRLLIELEDQPRRFIHEDLKFKDAAVQQLFSEAEKSQVEKFLNRPKGPSDVRYEWFYKFLAKINDGVKGSHLFNERKFVSEILLDNAKEAHRKMVANEKFPAMNASVFAALANREDFLEVFSKESGRSKADLEIEFDLLTRAQALALASFKQSRNANLVKGAFEQARTDIQTRASHLNPSKVLLLNDKAIIDIGPRLLDLLVDEAAYQAMNSSDRKNSIPMDLLAIHDHVKLVELTELGRSRMQIRAKFSMVTKELTTDKFYHLTQMSSSIRPSAEIQGGDLNSLDLLLDQLLMDRSKTLIGKRMKAEIKEMPLNEFLVSFQRYNPILKTMAPAACLEAFVH